MIIIYKYTDTTNNKLHYGQTKRALILRHKEHLSERSYLNSAIIAHGIKNFKLEIVEECINKQQADEREKFYIARDKTNNKEFGYNLTAGGDGAEGCIRSEETRKKISAARMGIKHSKETREKISKAVSGKNHPYFGKKRPEHGKKISAIQTGKKRPIEFCNNMSKVLTGRKLPEEVKRKIRETMRNKFHGEPRENRTLRQPPALFKDAGFADL